MHIYNTGGARVRKISAVTLITVSLIVGLSLLGCASKLGAARQPDPLVIQAHTAGFVPRAASIKVVLAEGGGEPGAFLARSPFSFDPPIQGTAKWEDENTVAFVPQKPLAAGRLYRARFDWGLLRRGSGVRDGGSTHDYFTFDFRTMDQKLELSFEPLRASADGAYELRGTASLTDDAAAAEVERCLSVSGPSIEGQKLDLSWSHDSGLLHRFTVRNIGHGPDQLRVKWSGRAVGSGSGGERSFSLPQKGEFKLLGTRPVSDGASRVELSFSQAIDRSQDLRGLVRADGVKDLRCEVEGGTLCLYAASWPEKSSIRVEPMLKAADGSKLAKTVSAVVTFKWEKPQIRYLSKGVILPTSQGLIVPIETMNVTGVIVEALRVYGDNMLQFLQVNSLSGNEELQRVGESVWKSRIDLGWKDEWKNKWVKQGLDLSQLLDKNKDGMFVLRITFRNDQIRYVCPNSHDFKALRFPPDFAFDSSDEGGNLWNYIREWPNRYDDYYKYKDDPCHPAYYIPYYEHSIAIQKNVLVSDIGAIARREASGQWTVAASDLRSTDPMRNVDVKLYSYQRRELASGKTDANGMVVLKPSKAPSFAVLSLGKQASYLKISNGEDLSTSHFDVGGENAENGLKGFIYGERGVWRPGDPMHLTFILCDRNKTVPAGDPLLFELKDPLGKVVQSGTYTASVNGFYAIETGTNADAPTGPYQAEVKIGGKTFTRSLRVETIMPNRLKISLDWGGRDYISTETERMNLSSAWLTGAPVGGLKADVSATFSAAGTSFKDFPDYKFDDPTREAPSGRTVLFEGNLDEKGNASFPIRLSDESLPPGKLRANLLTRVFEPSGVFSSESTAVDYYPYKRYVGVRIPKGNGWMGALPTGQDNKIDLALINQDGSPVKSGRISVALYKLSWRWWWESGDETLAQIASELYEKPIQRTTVNVVNGKAAWSFKINDDYWGRYLVRAVDADGGSYAHAAGAITFVDWPYYTGGGRGDSGGVSTMLTLETDKTKYSVGEKARITFASNAGGRALVAIERAGRLLKQEWIQTGKDRTVYELPLSSEMAPNVYVHVTFVQPHLQTANDVAIRVYGIVPVMVEDPGTRLSPLVMAPSEIAPDSDVSFSVREAKGRPMTCTVAVVDEGLLGITKFAAPNPWDSFYKKEASSLQTFDLYDYVAGAYSGKLETLLAIGGSDEGLGGGQRKQNRFPPVVQFFEPFEVKAGATVKKTFHMGSYVGAVRFMVVAGSANVVDEKGGAAQKNEAAAFGCSESSVPVRSKLMAQLTAPRVLSADEEVSIPATVFSFLGKATARLALSVSGNAKLVGPDRTEIQFVQDGDKSADFRIKADAAPGPVHISLRVESQGASAVQNIDLDVRALGVAVHQSESAGIEAGGSWDKNLSLPGAPGTNTVSVEFSRLPGLNLGQRLEWLIGYPHGCAEQTTSKAFGQLYLPKAVDLSKEKQDEVRDNINFALQKLPRFQTPRGGFTLWQGENDEGEYLSAYVTYFLVSAQREGYPVDPGMLNSALDYIADDARSWGSHYNWSKSVQGLRLYVLALAGRADLAAMNRFSEYGPFTATTQLRLAAAYGLAGQRDQANRLLSSAKLDFGSEDEDLEYYTYGSVFREKAAALDALNSLGDTARGLALYKEIAERMNQDSYWLSTQEIGAALEACLPYAAMASAGGTPAVELVMNGGKAQRLTVDKSSLSLELPQGRAVSASCQVRNVSNTPVFMRVAISGTPARSDEQALSKGLGLSVRYFNMDDEEVDPDKLPLGSDFIIKTTVKNLKHKRLENLALTQKLPAGWEIVTYRKGADLPKKNEDRDYDSDIRRKPEPLYDYQDVRDDQVLTYFSLSSQADKTFTVYVNKTYDGRFYLPAVNVESMYSADLQAIEPGRWLSDPPKAETAEEKRNSHNQKQ